MTTNLFQEHKQRFTEIKASLTELGYREAAFIRVELLFFEALTISRSYGNDEQENGLLAALKHLQADEYAAASGNFAKAIQRERAIRRFVNGFKIILTKACKNLFLQLKATAML
ncbi:MAG TPA: hypothetical protein VM884_10695 [Flavisolibacter sp.]|jgi:hypothetical protein|nr:hypothetical protein [Flavisolibacter sp.]